MDLVRGFAVTLSGYIVLILLAFAIYQFNMRGYLEDDSLPEELLEEIIEEATDLDIDISGDSDEQ